ncbi:MAG: YIP1 family protein [Thermoanaerobaculia bacterium]
MTIVENASVPEADTDRSWLGLLLGAAFRPRPTIRWILDHRPRRGILLLVVLAFLSSILNDTDWTLVPLALDHFSPAVLAGIVIGVVLVTIAVGIGVFYLFAGIATLTGRLVEGRGTYRQVRTALAWGTAPLILAAVYRVPALLFWTDAFLAFGGSGDESAIRIGDGGTVAIDPGAVPDAPLGQIAILLALELAVLAWYLAVSSLALAEAQGVASWRGFANLLLALVLPVLAVIIAVVSAVLA